MKDNQEITDKELQQLIDINGVDSGEPDRIRQPVDTFTDEWYVEQTKEEPLLIRIKLFLKYFFKEEYSEPLWKSVLKVIAAYSVYMLFVLPLALLGILICFALGISYEWGPILAIISVSCIAYIVWKIRRKKGPPK